MLESRIHRGKLVTVSQFTSIATGQREAATVSWASIGSVPPERAREFAAELATAIQIAEEWNAEDTDQMEPATVSWVSVGDATPERAQEFAAELAAAIDMAEGWNTNYHGRMMNIPTDRRKLLDASTEACDRPRVYEYGHRDARHAAAEIALEADIRIARLEALFAEMWRIATEAAFANQDTRCCFCNTPQGRLHEANCALNAWQKEGSDE